MNKQEFYVGVQKLERAYNTKFDKEKLTDWFNALKDMDYETYINRIENLKKTNKFMPNIAEIRDENNKKQYVNYDQREYTDIDFSKLYAN